MIQEIQGLQQYAPDSPFERLQFDFLGEWLPDIHPLKIANGNFSDCQNIRYTKTGIIGVNGYTRINTTPISTYVNGRNGFQLRTPNTQKSYIFTQQWNAALSASVLAVHKGVPPNTGDFEGTYIHTDATGAQQGFFVEAPNNDMVYCNSVETLIYGGEESGVASFIKATGITAITPTTPITYTDEIRNTLTDADNVVAFTAATDIYLIGSTRPLSGFKPYISVFNAVASTITVKEWVGTAWASVTGTVDGTAVGGITHAQIGGVTFNSTVATSKPVLINDLLLYWYQVSVSAGSFTLYHLTVNCPMQPLVNLWDGVNRVCISFQVNRSGIYEDYTPEVYDVSTSAYPIAAKLSGLSSTDYAIMMFSDRITAIKVAFLPGLVNTLVSTLTLYYWNGTTWASVGTIYDGSLDSGATKSMNKNGTIYWNPPAATAEHKVNLFSTFAYAYKLEWSGGLSAHTEKDITNLSQAAACVVTWVDHDFVDGDKVTFSGITQADWSGLNGNNYEVTVIDADTFSIVFDSSLFGTPYDPVTDPGLIKIVTGGYEDGCYLDTLYGIPCTQSMGAYKFAFNYKNRLFLAGDIPGKEGHSIDYAVANTSDSFNGEDSSSDNKRIYVGKNSSDIVATANIFNRFGASLYNSEIVTKSTETFLLDGHSPETFTVSQISENIGCAAPRTMCTAEVAFEITKDAIRNIAMWISYVGPILFDAAVLVPLSGINLYFDRELDTCVNFDAIENSHGWFDPNHYEWNVCLPSGAGQVACNVWLTYNLISKKWSKINTGTKPVPQATVKVVDDNGNVYHYGLLDTGYMVRLDYGSLWDGTEAIEAFVITNAMLPTTNIFDITILRNVKLITESDGAYDIIYTRADIEIKGAGIESGNLRLYGHLIEDSSNTGYFWDGENFVCKQLIESGTPLIGNWTDINGVVTINGILYEDWVMEITTIAGDFITAGFIPGLMIMTSDPNNPGPFLCTTVTANKMTFLTGPAVDFQAGASITLYAMFVKVEYYNDGDTTAVAVPFQKFILQDEITRFMSSCNYTGLCHKLKFSFYSQALSNNIRPLAWGIQFIRERAEA
jgi:hypothetical protein